MLDRIRNLCLRKKITIAKLERDLGFANGSRPHCFSENRGQIRGQVSAEIFSDHSVQQTDDISGRLLLGYLSTLIGLFF